MPAIVLNRPHPLAPGNAGVPAHPISPCSSLRRTRESARPFRSSASGTIPRCARLSHLPQTPGHSTLPPSRSSDCSCSLPRASALAGCSWPSPPPTLDSNASPRQNLGAPGTPRRNPTSRSSPTPLAPGTPPSTTPPRPLNRASDAQLPHTATAASRASCHRPPPKNLENAPTASPPAGIAAHGTPPGVSESQERHPTPPHYFSSSLQQHPHPSATARRQHMDKAETLPTQYPTTRSTRSRNKSACPKCREYSSIMCR